MKIGLFFGSFNPIHIGHVAIANYMATNTDLDQVWLVVSPHNPLKKIASLADAKKRYVSVEKAIGRNINIKVSNIEFDLPQPSYTINTLSVLKKKHPKNKFIVIIGADNLGRFNKWKDYKKILSGYKIYVYPRKGAEGRKLIIHRNVKLINAPLWNVSSTFIREQIKKGKSVKRLMA